MRYGARRDFPNVGSVEMSNQNHTVMAGLRYQVYTVDPRPQQVAYTPPPIPEPARGDPARRELNAGDQRQRRMPWLCENGCTCTNVSSPLASSVSTWSNSDATKPQ